MAFLSVFAFLRVKILEFTLGLRAPLLGQVKKSHRWDQSTSQRRRIHGVYSCLCRFSEKLPISLRVHHLRAFAPLRTSWVSGPGGTGCKGEPPEPFPLAQFDHSCFLSPCQQAYPASFLDEFSSPVDQTSVRQMKQMKRLVSETSRIWFLKERMEKVDTLLLFRLKAWPCLLVPLGPVV